MKLHYPASAHDIYTDGGCVCEVQIGDFMVVKGSICFSGVLGTKLIQIKWGTRLKHLVALFEQSKETQTVLYCFIVTDGLK